MDQLLRPAPSNAWGAVEYYCEDESSPDDMFNAYEHAQKTYREPSAVVAALSTAIKRLPAAHALCSVLCRRSVGEGGQRAQTTQFVAEEIEAALAGPSCIVAIPAPRPQAATRFKKVHVQSFCGRSNRNMRLHGWCSA